MEKDSTIIRRIIASSVEEFKIIKFHASDKNHQAELAEYLRKRHDVYVGKGWEDKSPLGIETDPFDEDCYVFIFCKNGAIEAGLRIICHNEANGLPISKVLPNIEVLPDSVEFSRVIPSKNPLLNCALFRLSGSFAKEELLKKVAYATIRPGFLKVFGILGIEFTRLGNSFKHRDNLFLVPIAITNIT